MTKKGVALLVLAIAGLVGAGASAASSPPASPLPPAPKPPRPNGPNPAPEPEPPAGGPEPYYVGPGWFWWFLDWSKDSEAFVAFQLLHAGNFFVRKVLGHGTGYDVLVFEVAIEPLDWTLPGKPTPAPKGIATELTDIESGPAPESSAWREYLEDMASTAGGVLQAYDLQFQQWLNQTFGGGS